MKATQIEPSSLAIGCRPPGQVDDREPAGAQRDARLEVDLLVVGPAMRDRAGHRQQPGGGELAAARQVDRTGDSAHLENPFHEIRSADWPATALVRSPADRLARDTINYNIPRSIGDDRRPSRPVPATLVHSFASYVSCKEIHAHRLAAFPGSPRRCPSPSRSRRRSMS